MNEQQRVVLVTGATGNLGRAVARRFRAAGDRLALVSQHAGTLADDFSDDGDAVLPVSANLMKQEDANAAVAQALARFGRIDVLCNIAGGFRMGEAVHETSDGNWDFLFGLNARTVLNMARAVVPHMLARGSGKIVNVASLSAQRGAALMGAYTASKSVVMRLTEAMAGELKGHGINVNCVLPGTLDTPENRQAMPGADPARWVQPDDLAQVIEFLSSPAARAIHGAAVPVTGLS
ncbi:SDR family NAD(P)-dependent oxidoreductase [Ideonella sp.]|uniref:SDR family NAD(P)-dependent oxidoreductase n=1 Tax=Ideonella sp. TaxID=1929293 RepID=UPI002B4A0677|nr:SDR family NAD(P)-dependent oxidoreductase [Ideonella sp.]HJV71922.1 SDR family NAD(P)-dependent oxidoreductase [Ideonella sp.]